MAKYTTNGHKLTNFKNDKVFIQNKAVIHSIFS